MQPLSIKQEVHFDINGCFGYIDKKPNISYSSGDLPKKFILRDKFSREFSANLISVHPFSLQMIPVICSYHALGVPPDEAYDILRDRTGIDRIDELAYYLFKKQ